MSLTAKPNIRFLKLLAFLSIAVLVIVELTFTSVGPPKKQSIDEAAELVSSKILLTRQKALASNTRYRLHYDYRRGECRVFREDSRGRWVPDTPNDRCVFPSEVSISSTSSPPDGYIEINEDGRIVSRDGVVLLRLSDSDSTLKSIRISPSGMVQEFPNW
ncbi:MAG: hypothetical protein JSW58_09705 [Candidatus Latescibacterota bacterium]|nr:MAG: hypothetical protein JSW58_09705 [Candidatus Latescibacterota bacterium]